MNSILSIPELSDIYQLHESPMRTYLFLLLPFIFGCEPKLKELPFTGKFKSRSVVGKSSNSLLQEASGLAVSFANPGHLWTHNDSGGSPEFYLITEKGDIALTLGLTGAENIDWEDMVISRNGSGHLYVGDIGDNRAVRDQHFVYRVTEPKIDSLDRVSLVPEKMTFQYAEGPRDSETLMIDPFTDDLILLTKREDRIMVYAFPFQAGKTITIQSLGTMDVTQLTAGDINKNGDVLIKNYNQLFYLENEGKTPIVQLLIGSSPLLVEYEIEKQGEALTWSTDDQSFFLLSEWNDNLPQPLYRYY